jgi:transcriptional regulator with XRE-family HTH domain
MDTAFNPDVFRWARESAGLALEDAARAIGIVSASLLAMERGEKAPSRTTLSKMAKAYHRSLLTFYLPAPPRQGDRGEDFRTVGADRTTAANAEVDALVRDLRARQRLVRTVLEDDEDTQPLAFIGSARVADGVAALVRAIEPGIRTAPQKLGRLTRPKQLDLGGQSLPPQADPSARMPEIPRTPQHQPAVTFSRC